MISGQNSPCENLGQEEYILEAQLRAYVDQNLYPFHMPGHKRRLAPAPGLPYDWDLTEVDGVDDLHDAEGILKDAMDRTARLFGAYKTWYLVGGSTVGILAAVRCAARAGSEIIAARNCHKSVLHAAELLNLRVHWVYPLFNDTYGIYGSVSPERVREMLTRYPDTSAVVITSPTYEGVLSDIASIAGICHRAGVPLIVDEAHGAHLSFMGEYPDNPPRRPLQSAVSCGADLVIQSAHKTLPSLTQTAFLHWNGSFFTQQEISRQLNVFETSSPSYPLMASLDGCTGILKNRGREMFKAYRGNLERLGSRLLTLKNLRVLGHGNAAAQDLSDSSFYALDPGKILICGGAALSGAALADILRVQYHIETEMHSGSNVLAMTSVCDPAEAFDLLSDALLSIDTGLSAASPAENVPSAGNALSAEHASAAGIAHESENAAAEGAAYRLPEREESVCAIGEALDEPAEEVPAEEAEGRICAEYVYCYPPGIPVLVPGERILPEHRNVLARLGRSGCRIHHSFAREGQDIFFVTISKV